MAHVASAVREDSRKPYTVENLETVIPEIAATKIEALRREYGDDPDLKVTLATAINRIEALEHNFTGGSSADEILSTADNTPDDVVAIFKKRIEEAVAAFNKVASKVKGTGGTVVALRKDFGNDLLDHAQAQ